MTHYSISVSHMSVELVQFVSVVESCYVHTNIYTLSLLKINAVDSEWTFPFLLGLFILSTYNTLADRKFVRDSQGPGEAALVGSLRALIWIQVVVL